MFRFILLNLFFWQAPFVCGYNKKFSVNEIFQKQLSKEVVNTRSVLTRSGPLTVSSTPYTFTDNCPLSVASILTFASGSSVVDGDGHIITFPNGSTNVFVINNSVNITLTDIVLENFTQDVISYGSGSSISFGDDVLILLERNRTIADSDQAWTFIGNSVINGFGNELKVEKSQGITIAGSGKTLTLRNLRLVTTVIDGLKVLTNDDARIKLENVELVLQDAGFTFDKGHLDIAGIVQITGANLADQNTTQFLFSSGGNLNIGENATLIADRHILLKYDADETLNSDTAEQAKRHWVFTYPSSTLHLKGCTLESGDNGLALIDGTLVVEDKVVWNISTAGGAEGELSSNLNTIVLSGANLDCLGVVKYFENATPILYGDSSNYITLKSANHSTYLMTDNTNFEHGLSEKMLGGVLSSSNNNSHWFLKKSGEIGNQINSHDELFQLHNRQYPTLKERWHSLELPPTSSPLPPYYFVYLTAGSNFVNLVIEKEGASLGDPINSGDVVKIQQAYHPVHSQQPWISTTSNQFTITSGTYQEIAGYSGGGTGGEPANDDHLWIIENV